MHHPLAPGRMTLCRGRVLLLTCTVILGGCTSSEPVPRPVAPSPSFEEARRGGPLLRVSGQVSLDSLDPGLMYQDESFFLARGVFRTLVTYVTDEKRVTELVPDLATDLGTSNDDLSEWRFELKQGVRFGPAFGGRSVRGVTGREVTSDDVKYAFERAFLPSVPNDYTFYYEDLVGLDAFIDGDATEISGITTPDERTIVFRLSRPAGDFPHRLTLPISSPVPRSLAHRFDIKKRSSYSRHAVATGPYYVESYRPGSHIGLRRNPHWSIRTDEVRKAHFGGMSWRLDVPEREGLAALLDGKQDLVLDDPVTNLSLELAVADRTRRARVRIEPNQCVRYIWMNTTIEPFDDVRVRRALSLAVDRYLIRRAFGGAAMGEIPGSVLQPGVAGHLPRAEYQPFSTPGDAGDPVRAGRALVGTSAENGWDERVLVLAGATPASATGADLVVSALRRLGFSNIKLRLSGSLSGYGRPAEKVAVGPSAGWCGDYLDAFSSLYPLFHGDRIRPRHNENFAQLDDAELNRLIDRAAALPLGPERAEAWAEANRRGTELAPWVPWLWENSRFIVSARLRGAVYEPNLQQIDWTRARLKGVSEGAKE